MDDKQTEKLANMILDIDDDSTDEVFQMKKQLDYILWGILKKYTIGIVINYDKLFNYDSNYILLLECIIRSRYNNFYKYFHEPY